MTACNQTRADLAPRLTSDDRADMLARVLKTCPALDDYDLIVVHLRRHGISLVSVARILGAAIDQARWARAVTSVSLGDAARDAVAKITTST